MGVYDRFQTDETCETNGVWAEYGEDGSFLLARAGGSNLAYEKACEKFRRKHKLQLDHDMMSSKQMVAQMVQVFADTVILGWRDISDENGDVLDFTRENVVKVMTDLPDLFEDLLKLAMNAQLYNAKLDEADAKN